MRNKVLGVFIAALCFLAVSVPLPAHHGSAGYDMEKQLVMKATVTDWLWANPHCFLTFDTTDDKGAVVHWTAEVSNPVDMTKRGWSKHILNARRSSHGNRATRQERGAGRATHEGCPSERPDADRMESGGALTVTMFKMSRKTERRRYDILSGDCGFERWHSLGLRAQSAPPQQPEEAKTHRAAPAPRRDLSGIWDVVDTMEGISPRGVKSHAPFTAEGAKIANDVYKPGDGPRRVPIGLANDPLDGCDPAGFPRNLLFELRPFQVVQTPNQMLMLYQYQKVWRVYLDRRPGASKGSGPAVVRILGREMGG